MKTAIAIIERDLRERRFIFVASLAFGFVPFIAVAILPGLRAHAEEFVAIFSAALLFFFPLAVALGLGSSMIGGDLTARRLSFYFSKPISSRSLWYGKLVAALVTIYAAMLLSATPGAIYTWNYKFGQWGERRSIFLASIIAAPAVLLLAHVLSTMMRSRSSWIAVDAIGLAVSAAAGYWILRPIFDAGATYLFIAVLIFLCAATLVALIVSGAWHLGRARTDRLANHIELSKYLWSALAIILAVAGSYVAWITHPSPERVTFEAVYPAPQGPWVAVAGKVPWAQDYRAAVLLNLENGKFVRLPSSEFAGGAIAFSRDGRAVAWTHNEIVTRSLDPVGEESRTAIRTSPEVLLVMSDDGKRLAYIDDGILNVADATNGHSLASVRVATPSRWFTWMYFATPDVVRLIVSKETPEQRNVPRLNTVDISELDVRTRHFVKTGTFNVMARYLWASATQDGSRLFVHSHRPADPTDAFFVVDARTGSRLQTLTPPRNNGFVSLDDRVLWINRTSQGLELVQETLNGDVSRGIDLGRGYFGYVIAGRGDRVLVSVFERNDVRPSGGLLVNVRTGAIERRMPGVRLTTPHHMYEDDPRIFLTKGPLVAGLDKADHIIRINLEDGTVRPLPN
jgi:hypothetical protein